MNVRLFSGIFMLLLLGAMAFLSLSSTPVAASKTGSPTVSEIGKGIWSARFEKHFTESIPFFNPSRKLWGEAEYELFGQGRKGVVVGTDGWLFSDEEFSCPPDADRNIKANLDFIVRVQKIFAEKGVGLAVVLIPAKARIYEDYLGHIKIPDCRIGLYKAAHHFLTQQDIPAPYFTEIMEKASNRDELYLKTDTHWSPYGAQLAAQETARVIGVHSEEKGEFTTSMQGAKDYEGDLMRYLPGVVALKADSLPVAETVRNGSSTDLFGDDVPPFALVGTSYSANPLWNFEGFLKEFLQEDVLNMADEGLGPFTVMDRFLAEGLLSGNSPRVVIWEIPERYLPMPHDINAGQNAEDENALF